MVAEATLDEQWFRAIAGRYRPGSVERLNLGFDPSVRKGGIHNLPENVPRRWMRGFQGSFCSDL
jgi:hypothetical protein